MQKKGDATTDFARQPGTVVLPELKLQAAKIRPEPARFDQLPIELGVAGRIEVNADRRIVIRPACSGRGPRGPRPVWVRT